MCTGYRNGDISQIELFEYVYIGNGDIKMYYARMGEIGYTCLQVLLYIDSNILSNNFRSYEFDGTSPFFVAKVIIITLLFVRIEREFLKSL